MDSTLGAIEMGGVLSVLFFGINTAQTYHYYRDYPKDRPLVKAAVWIFQLVHNILTWQAIYALTVTFFGHPEHVRAPPRTLYFTLVVSALTTTITDVFFANRIRVISQRWPIAIICWTLTFLELLANAGMIAIFCTNISGVSVLQVQYRWLMSTALVMSALVDVLITATLCYYLLHVRNSTLEKTRRIADTLITWSIESTMIKTLVISWSYSRALTSNSGAAILQLIMFLTRDDLIWGFFYLIQSALHTNSMLPGPKISWTVCSPASTSTPLVRFPGRRLGIWCDHCS
ncbi:hypothetical protein GGX14DRAFT_457512 [Mycena pura]|uniref:DUF6534 domain-containing protein n=1 Tax=Mycena pura TaxID=153505 RepID=A0AAD6V918_9AGAR|nr:hypothetical protein GGX14DRAFT_457512 [Mycena pura]